MTGGVSHVDSFDPKPKLVADHGKTITVDNWQGKLGEFTTLPEAAAVGSSGPAGKCGTEVSDLFPHVRTVVDDLCVIRSMKSDHTNHYQATLGMHTGSFTFARPSIGSWVSYGLGTENQNLPSFVVLAPQLPYAGTQIWGSRLPARLPPGHARRPRPRADRQPRPPRARRRAAGAGAGAARRRQPPSTSRRAPADAALAARIRSFETAFGMQREAPEAFDLSQETDATLGLYGLERGQTDGFGWQCLVARRLAERGVRFIELIDTGSSRQLGLARQHGRPRAAGQERRPADRRPAHGPEAARACSTTRWSSGPPSSAARRTTNRPTHAGREHHHQAFSSWLAGGGVKGGIVYGATDDLRHRRRPRTRSTSTTSTPRSCTCSASTTSG